MVALTDAGAPMDADAYALALRHVQDWRVVVWARGVLMRRGVAPSTDMLLQRAEASRLELPEEVRLWLPALGSVSDVRARRWAFRLRKRWGGRFATVRVREEIGLEEMWSKASRINLLAVAVLK